MRTLTCLVALITLSACSGPGLVSPPPVKSTYIEGLEAGKSIFTALLAEKQTYTLGVEDILEIKVLDLEKEGELLEIELEIAEDGTVPIPILGAVTAEGKTLSGFRSDLVKGLSERFIANPFVSVKIKEHKSRRIAVLGPVTKPGVHYLARPEITVNEALGLAEGLTEFAGLRAVVIHGGERPSQRDIDLDALSRGDVTQNAILRHGDVLHVLKQEQFWVAGFVENPGMFEFRHEMSVRKAVSLAGGIKIPDASPDMTRIRRRGPEGEYFIPIDLNGIIDDEAPDVQILAGDILEVRQSDFRYFAVGLYDAVKGVINVGVNAASLF